MAAAQRADRRRTRASLWGDRIDVHSPRIGGSMHIKSSCRGTLRLFCASRSRSWGTKSIKSHFLQKKLCEDLAEEALRGRTMNPPDEFQKRAADCMHMARLSRD